MSASLTKIVNNLHAKDWKLQRFQKNAKPADDELKLELITYEKQQKGSDLSLELIYDDRATKKGSGVNADLDEQVLKLGQQVAQMAEQNSSKDTQIMRGFATGLQTRQLEAFRRHVEKAAVDDQEKRVEMLRGATGLQRTQLEALKKQVERQAQDQQKGSQISAKVAVSNPPRSRL